MSVPLANESYASTLKLHFRSSRPLNVLYQFSEVVLWRLCIVIPFRSDTMFERGDANGRKRHGWDLDMVIKSIVA